MKKTMEEKITRRELFRRAARMLPIIALASVPIIPAIAKQVNDCNGTCKATCNNGCHGTHKGMCSTCSHGCLGGCYYTCGSACDGKCMGSAKAVTDTTPKTKRDSCKCECHKHKNDTIINNK